MPAHTIGAKTPFGITMTLAGATGVSAIAFVDTPMINGQAVTTASNFLAGRFYGRVSAPTWSAMLAEMGTTFGTGRLASLETTAAFGHTDIFGLAPTFTVDVAQDVTNAFKVSGNIVDAAPITVEPGGTVMFISNGTLAINAPITIKGNGTADLRYDYAQVQHGGAVTPSDFSFGTGGSLTYLTSAGATATTSQGSALRINDTPYTLVYSMAQLDAIDGVNGVTSATISTFGAGANGSYALAGNLNASGTTYGQALVGSFNGTFEGLGHAISNLTINSPSTQFVQYAGLFAISNGLIRDLSLANVSVTALTAELGGLAGESDGAVINVSASGSLTNLGGYGTNADTGGLIGRNQGTVKGASFAGSISDNFADTDSQVGGLVGENVGRTAAGASIINSSSSGTISGGYAVGGLVGYNNAGTNLASVNQSFSTAGVSGHDIIGGGLVGVNYGAIANSYAGGAVNGGGTSWYIGGLVGVEGYGIGTVTASYAFGGVSNPGQAPDESVNIGGVASGNGATLTNAYWDTQSSGQATSAGGTGRTTAQLQSGALPAGFDPAIWTAAPGAYPKLKGVAGQ